MNIRKIKIKNAGPFASFETDVKLGSIGVFGRNGCGKTTLMRLVHAAITRRFNMFPGLKSEIALAGSKGASYIDLLLEEQGQTAEVCLSFASRKSTTGYSRLKLKGEKEITVEADISERLAGMGIVPGLLDTSGFVYDVFAFLDMTDAKRAEFYRFLCGVEKATTIHKILQETRVKAKDAEYLSGQEASFLDMIAGKQAEISSIDARILKVQERRATDEKRQRVAKRVQRHKQFLQLSEELEKLAGLTARVKTSAESKQKHYENLLATENQLEQKYEAVKDKYTEAKVLLANYEREQLRWEKKKQLLARVERLEEHACLPPVKFENYRPVDELNRRLAGLQALLKQEEQRRQLGASSSSNCPTCEQPLHNVEALLLRIDDNIDSLTRQCKALVLRRDRAELYERSLADHLKDEETRLSRVASLRSQLEDYKDTEEPVLLEETSAFVDSVKSVGYKLAKVRTQVREAQTDYNTARTRYEALVSQQTKKQQQCESLKKYYSEKVDKLAAFCKRQDKLQAMLAQANRDLQSQQRSLNQLNERLTAVQSAKVENEKAAKLQALYERGAALMHWGALPARVISKTLTTLAKSINESLEMFDSPFTVEATDDMSFNVTLPGLPPRDVRWLSKGQRVVLAVAFWSAASLFERSPGLLVLDEPTANLDTENVAYLGEALQYLRSSVRGNRQIIMTSHAHSLRDSFDQVIEIGK